MTRAHCPADVLRPSAEIALKLQRILDSGLGPVLTATPGKLL